MTLVDTLFSFEGRLRRRDWWLLNIGWAVFTLIASEVIITAAFGSGYSLLTSDILRALAARLHDPAVATTQFAIMLVSLWPVLAMAARRAHDRDRIMAPVIVAIVLATLYDNIPGGAFTQLNLMLPATIAGFLSLALDIALFCVDLWLIIVLGFLDGTPGSNQFGPSPKAFAVIGDPGAERV